jgi:hypothetical protein
MFRSDLAEPFPDDQDAQRLARQTVTLTELPHDATPRPPASRPTSSARRWSSREGVGQKPATTMGGRGCLWTGSS